MKTMSASLADSPAGAGRNVLVWDLPVRLFHWLMVLSFAGAWLTAESERWRLVHVTLGYTMAGLVAFRLVWGLVGTRHARFTSFVRGPRAVVQYVRSLLQGRAEHHVGHNPAGAIAIVALLSLAALVTVAGWATYNEAGGEWLEELHEGAANAMLILVAVHIAGVVIGSMAHRENLVRAMFTGRKPGRPEDAISRTWRPVGALLLAAVLGFWWLQWQAAPANADSGQPGISAESRHHDDDD